MDVNISKLPGGDSPARRVVLQRPDPNPAGVRPAAGQRTDAAELSDEARVRAERLRQPDSSRRELVDAARARLVSGELAQPEVYRTVAERLLDGGGA